MASISFHWCVDLSQSGSDSYTVLDRNHSHCTVSESLGRNHNFGFGTAGCYSRIAAAGHRNTAGCTRTGFRYCTVHLGTAGCCTGLCQHIDLLNTVSRFVTVGHLEDLFLAV